MPQQSDSTPYNPDFAFYLETLRAGRDYFVSETGSRSEGLTRALKELGKFTDVSMEHVRHLYTKWTSERTSHR